MIRVACPHCGTKYRFDPSRFAGKSLVRAKCQKCGEGIEIEPAEMSAARSDESSSADTTARVRRLRSDEAVAEQTVTGARVAEVLELPPDKKYSLSVQRGRAQGQLFPITKVRTTIGRADCDIVLDDPECSRRHAVLEILGSRCVIQDLNSTNGTIVDGRRVERAELENLSEFRVGDHVLMLIVTDRE